MYKASIVILNWNGSNFLQQFLPSLLQNTHMPEIEFVVADNASTDNSLDILKQKFPQVRVIKLDKNYGFAEGYNRALSQIQAEYYVILNSDVEVTPGWLQPLIAFLDQNSTVAAVMPKILSYTKKNYFEYAGASGGFIDYLGYPFCRGRILDTIEPDNNQYDSILEVFWATGACMVIRSEIFHKLGGFDAHFFAHMEEIDLCWRIKLNGYKIYCVPNAIVYHVGGGALPNNHPFKLYLNFRNNLFLLYKNLPQHLLYKTLFQRILFDYAAAFMFIAKFQISFFVSVVKAHIHFFYSLNDLKTYRKKNYKLLEKEAGIGIYKKSIIVQYFLKKKKKYCELNFF